MTDETESGLKQPRLSNNKYNKQKITRMKKDHIRFELNRTETLAGKKTHTHCRGL